jgi:diguanylate cyclase (GGDEF)-like protein/PAS domain S-box-containing protein
VSVASAQLAPGAELRVADNLLDEPIGEAGRSAHDSPNEIGAAPSHRPLDQKTKGLLSEVARLDRAVAALKKQCALQQALIDATPDHLWVKDVDGAFVVANMALAANCGRANAGEMIGLSDFDIHTPERAQDFHDVEQEIIRRDHPMAGIKECIQTGDGGKRWFSTTKSPLHNAHGEIVALLGVGRDITQCKLAEDTIRFMSNHDALTGLPNRALLADRLNQAMLFAQRYDRWVTVVSVDLDGFKLVNNTFGHRVGDQLLAIVAGRIHDCVKETDTVVRLGGDEFAVVLVDQPRNTDLITATLQNLREAICEPARIEGHSLQVTGSIGLANYPNDGTDADALLANAAAAMYRAKEIGRDSFQFYTPELNARVHAKFRLQEELRNAIAHKEFFLLFQPQVDLRAGRIFAVEALIRWRHPSQGVTPPDRFIPIAEESGLIVEIGDWALRSACKQNKAWQDAGLAPINVSVNVSARQFQDKNWVHCVVGALQESGLEARYLELELTESLIMQDVDQAVATMKELQRLGVQLSIDDFGTGYSSLNALKTFPVARLKIDKSFVRDLPHDQNDRAVVAAVISLGQKLNLRVIAEGVETDEQLAFLRENNCAEVQGYLFSKPILPAEIEDLLKRGPDWAGDKRGGCADRPQ